MNSAFLNKHYHEQIQALNHFIADTYAFLLMGYSNNRYISANKIIDVVITV